VIGHVSPTYTFRTPKRDGFGALGFRPALDRLPSAEASIVIASGTRTPGNLSARAPAASSGPEGTPSATDIAPILNPDISHCSVSYPVKRWQTTGHTSRIEHALDDRIDVQVDLAMVVVNHAGHWRQSSSVGVRCHRRCHPRPAAARHADDAIVDRQRAGDCTCDLLGPSAQVPATADAVKRHFFAGD
jgi:hypothetical protein